tara:strand:+ start:784 stop:954 length:171 start_codon:yes stop_codon:yes gene_type:complete
MVLIQVKPEEKAKVFEILATKGKFMGLSDNRFNIIENEEEVLKKIKDAGIEPNILD